MKIGIVGLGLMGGSIAKALKPHHEIHALDRDQNAIQFALNNNIIDFGYLDPADFFKRPDVIYVCLYPRELVDFVKNSVTLFKKETILIEISGVKTSIVQALEPFIPENIEMVYSHPVAGREKIGVASSNVSIFVGANYIIVPLDSNSTKALDLTDRLAREMGFASISYLSLEKHDAIIAYTSQLTHILSLALVLSDDQSFETGKFIGDSYRDLTRIAMINSPLWAELFMENKTQLLEKIKGFKLALNAYESCLENSNEIELVRLMNTAKAIRLGLERNNLK